MAENEERTQRPVLIRTLADLGPRDRLDAHCHRCRRSRQLDVLALLAAYGPVPLDQLRRRLRCARCGARWPAVIRGWDT
jgi:hypothetical protein